MIPSMVLTIFYVNSSMIYNVTIMGSGKLNEDAEKEGEDMMSRTGASTGMASKVDSNNILHFYIRVRLGVVRS